MRPTTDAQHTRNAKLKPKQPIVPLAFSIYFTTVMLIALVGLVVSIYMAYSHSRVYLDIDYRSFCAISQSFNCDTVSQSAESILWGMPVATWGIFGYSFFIIGLLFAGGEQAQNRRMWSILFGIALLYSLYSVVLAAISIKVIRSICIMCLVSYAINFMLLFYVWLIRRRFVTESWRSSFKGDLQYLHKRKKHLAVVLGSLVVILVVVWGAYPKYWMMAPPELGTEIPRGVTEEGHPWIGAETPELEITEFSDYLCFQCKKMHFYLRLLIERHPGKLRIVHRHFPMDDEYNPLVKAPLHVGSGRMALLAIFAQTKGKFWEMNDTLFQLQRTKEDISVRAVAEKVGLDFEALSGAIDNRGIQRRLMKDLWDGFQLKITGTPTFVVNGEVHRGQVPPSILEMALHAR
jgi:uncharacterized membrane protein/protein-disulfide isomerase